MQNGHLNNQQECLECDLPTQEYLNYFDGLFMTARDFHTEQSHRIGKHRQHNRYLHGWGTVCGLRIVQHPDPACRDRFVILEPGLALDCCGREIVVREQVYIDLVKYLAPQEGNATSAGNILLFSLCYAECKTEFVPALYAECGCDEVGCEASRIHEGYEIEVQRVNQLPQSLATDPVGVRLQWKTTFNLAQAAYLALDSNRKRLYVLTAADPGQIMVYDTNNGVLLTTISKVEARGVGLAIDPTGQFLYVMRHIAGTPGNYFLRVIDIHDLNNPSTVNDLPLTDGNVDNPPLLRVSPVDGKIFTLDINARPKNLIIWKTDINSSLAGAAINAAKYAEVTTATHPHAISTDPRSIAVSPDGTWLFIGDGASNQIQVSRIDTLSPPANAQVTQTVSLGETPSLLAISGDSLRLYVVTVSATGSKVRAFRIEVNPPNSPPTLTEIGAGVAINTVQTADPVALAVSPSGKWAYVLSQDRPTGKGKILVINGEKLAADPGHAVLPPTAVLANPQDLLLSPDGRQIYASGSDTQGKPSGVSILDVDEEPCRELLWRALEGCPTCPEDACVPLAAIQPYTKDKFINDEDIDNRIRPLVPSTETLRKLILCALETGTGKQGPEGQQGPPGKDGEGLERDLPYIQALSWTHNGVNNSLIAVQGIQGPFNQGVVIGFSSPVIVADSSNTPIIDTHVFQVLAEFTVNSQTFNHCRLQGMVVPVSFTATNNLIESAQLVSNQVASGVAYIFNRESLGLIQQGQVEELWIRLLGDFVVDASQKKAIDAKFVQAILPTGLQRPSGARIGTQGGVFESWCRVVKNPQG